MSYGKEILTTAFATGQNGPHPKDIDLRLESYEIRSALKGNPVAISNGHTQVDEIPIPLLRTVSPLSDTRIQYGIFWPSDSVSRNAVNILVSYLKDLTKATKTFDLHLSGENETTATALEVVHAAQVLGMDKYVSHLVRKLDAIFHNMPTYEQLDTVILHPAGKMRTRFYKIAVNNFAHRVRLGNIPDPDVFDDYLKYHRLDFAENIDYAIHEYKTRAYTQEKREKREQERFEAAEKAKKEAEEVVKREKEHRVAEKQFWDTKKATDAKIRKSVDAKLRASGRARKFTAEERAWYVKMHGKQPPKGC